MAVEDILKRIETEAGACAEELRRQGAGEAARVEKDGGERSAQLREEVLADGAYRAEREHERLLSVARLEERKQFLAAKQELLGELFKEAGERIAKLGDEEAMALLARVAFAAVTGGDEEIVFSEGDRKRLGDKLVKRLNKLLADSGRRGECKLSAQTRPINGGLIVLGGKREANCTFDALFKEERSNLEPEVARLLFADEKKRSLDHASVACCKRTL